jgi:uroporphyrinogen decarboxylase
MTKKENLIRTIQRNHPEWVPYRYDGSLTFIFPRINSRPREGGTDDWGVQWIPTHTDEGSYPKERPYLKLDQIKTFRAPNLDWEGITSDLKEKVDALSSSDTLCIARNEMLLFERAKLLLGTVECLMAYLVEPQSMHVLMDIMTDFQIKLVHAIMKSGIAGIRFTDDWGTQKSLFIHPDLWRTFVKPRLKIIYGVVKDYGGFVFQHSCGHIEEIVPDLIDLGVDVLDPCQPQSNDIFRWKKEYGDQLSFMGGLDTQRYLSFGTPDQVKSSVKKVVEIMHKGGGYIAAPSHTIRIPEANQQAMLEGIDEVNHYAGQ